MAGVERVVGRRKGRWLRWRGPSVAGPCSPRWGDSLPKKLWGTLGSLSRARTLRFSLITIFNTYSHAMRKGGKSCHPWDGGDLGSQTLWEGRKIEKWQSWPLHSSWPVLKPILLTTTSRSRLCSRPFEHGRVTEHTSPMAASELGLTSRNSVPGSFDVWTQTQFHAYPQSFFNFWIF